MAITQTADVECGPNPNPDLLRTSGRGFCYVRAVIECDCVLPAVNQQSSFSAGAVILSYSCVVLFGMGNPDVLVATLEGIALRLAMQILSALVVGWPCNRECPHLTPQAFGCHLHQHLCFVDTNCTSPTTVTWDSHSTSLWWKLQGNAILLYAENNYCKN